MNLQPDVISRLRTLLAPIRALDQRINELSEPTAAAQTAITRLEEQIADLDAKAAQAAHRPIAPDEDRVAALLAGGDVAQRDKKEIEAAAASVRLFGAQRQQAATDLAAVQAKLEQLTTDTGRLLIERDRQEASLLTALADELLTSYKRDITELVRSHFPPVFSACDRVFALTGERLSHAGILGMLRVLWSDLDMPVESAGMGRQLYKTHVVWPRIGGTLVTGEPLSSPDVLAAMIEEIWTHQE